MSKVELRYNTCTDLHRLEVKALSHTTLEVARKTPYKQQEFEMITQEKLKEYFTYDKTTGLFHYNKKITDNGWNNHHYGKVAGGKSNGYILLGIKKEKLFGHRMAWLYEYGYLPEEVDHINHIRNDNRLCNLREVTRKENAMNMTVHPSNKSGVTGVSFYKDKKKWVARIMHNGKYLALGSFDEKEDAIVARQEANIKYGYHANHGRGSLL